MISGPSTRTESVGSYLNGNPIILGSGKTVAEATQCLTDTFTVTNQENLPVICGINSGYHIYFDAADECNSLNLQLGNVAQGLAGLATRSWSIKVNQYACDYLNLAPTGCDQFHFGSAGSNFVRTFNYQSGRDVGKHLANQHQTICVRREAGMCQICWSAAAAADVGLSGKISGRAQNGGTLCCGYGADGFASSGNGAGGDCIIIPGAVNAAGMVKPDKICGTMMGLNTEVETATADVADSSTTVCSTHVPFRIEFHSDDIEFTPDDGIAAMLEAEGGNHGFKVMYFQTTC